jgi:glycosyltransferase involved in cell wall biosynthesis
MRVALVHDFLLDVRGAERVFLTMADLWPEADVYTAVYDPRGTEFRLSHRPVHTTFLQKLRPTARSFRALLPLYPMAIESLDLRGYDLVLSSSSAWSHGVLPAPGAVHVCYCHNPFRYAWSEREATLAARTPAMRLALSPLLSSWRRWDWHAAQHVDRYLANSETTRKRIKEYWHRDATVVYPPVDTHRFTPVSAEERDDYYVALGELMPHKRLDVIIKAFNSLGRKLLIVGDGPEARRLRRLAGPTISFAGRVSDAEVAGILARCRALVVAATEEFGIAAVEAQAAGRPVIAFADGGVEETVRGGVTGTFFRALDPVHLADVVRGFDDQAIDPQACADSAEQFGIAQFGSKLRFEIEKAFNAPGRGAEPREQRRPLPSPVRLRTRG